MRKFVVAADRNTVGFGPAKALIGQVDKGAWPREALIGLKLIAPDSPECESVRSESSLTDAAQGHDRIRFFLKERLLRNFRDVARAFLNEAGPCAVEVTSAEFLDEGSRAFFEALSRMHRGEVVMMRPGPSGAGALVNTPSATEQRVEDAVRRTVPSEDDLDFLYEQAIRYLSVGDSWTAVRVLEALLPHRGTPAVWGRLGLAHAMLGRSLEAEFCYLRWREDPDPVSSAGASYALSMLYARHHPAHLRSLDRTARFLEEGTPSWRRRIRTPRTSTSIRCSTGMAMLWSSSGVAGVDEAVARYAGIEKLRSGSAKNHMHQTVLIYNLAQCYRRIGENEAAIETYGQLLEVDGKMPEYHMELAHCYMDAGNADEALKSLLTARELGPSIPEVHSLLGYVYLQSGDIENAEVSYRAAYECDERDFESVYDYAYILAETERPQEALTVVEGRGLDGLDAEQQARLLTLAAEQHAGLGNLSAARTALEQVLVLTPEDPDARSNLDQVLEACA